MKSKSAQSVTKAREIHSAPGSLPRLIAISKPLIALTKIVFEGSMSAVSRGSPERR
ncbi:hypothetical protein ACSBOB_22315 [Mesorhizobium sp. ASY16-5R]|uniref:hypothetical protein n=1 Tax=Mesorhizobium sp. ASY16-5R TaxID=3445772 RepID=UPI003FA12361